MPQVICPNCDEPNNAPETGASFLCSACCQPIRIAKKEASPPPPPKSFPPESTLLLRDIVRSLRVIAMFVAFLSAIIAAWVFGGFGDGAFDWMRRVIIFGFVMFVAGWIVLTRKKII